MTVFVALVELQPLEGCDLNPSKISGAAVRCYVDAASRTDALGRLRDAFEQDRFLLREIEWCVADDEVEWENPDDAEGTRCVLEARESGDVVYGEFHVWQGDD